MLFHLQEFELDKDIKLELDKQKHDRIDIVRKELAWEAEKQRIALEKLRKRYTVHMTLIKKQNLLLVMEKNYNWSTGALLAFH